MPATVMSNRSAKTKLYTVHYQDGGKKIRLTAYADTIIIETGQVGKKPVHKLAGIRMGGYPESVRAMADAIYGGGTLTVEPPDGKPFSLITMAKRYSREHRNDGNYAEALLLVKDEIAKNKAPDGAEGENQITPESGTRTNYIYCTPGDSDGLFSEVDRLTTAPLIPAFKEYMLSELQSRGILKKLEVLSCHPSLEAWRLHLKKDDANIFACVNDGIASGRIAVPGAVQTDAFIGIDSMSKYLAAFGVKIAQRIRDQFTPLFDPAVDTLSDDVLAVNSNIKSKTGYSLYPAQLAAAEALKRRLSKAKFGLLIAECGSGKTKIGSAAISAAMQTALKATSREKSFNIVMCPSHVQEKWVREIHETIPRSRAAVVKSITELERLYSACEKGGDSYYIILSKEKARDGYMRRPAVLWNNRRKAFLCPDCMGTLEMDVTKDDASYRTKADHLHFRNERPDNRVCRHCGGMLWEAINPDRQSAWVKVTDYGFVHCSFAEKSLELKLPQKVLDDIARIAANPDGYFPASGAYRRFALSTYIKQHMRGRIHALLADELHQYNNKSGQGDAMGEIYGTAKKCIGMTATLINGYATGIFHLLYRIAPHLMLLDDKPYDKPSRFSSEYGVTEYIELAYDESYAANRRTRKAEARERAKPGVSPLVYSRFLLEAAVFLSLSDMGKHLPDYEEIPIALNMPKAVDKEYTRIEAMLSNILKRDKSIAKKVLSRFMALLTVYPDQPYHHKPILHPFSKLPLIEPKDLWSADRLNEKDEKVLALVKEKIAHGERVLIYTSWTRIDTQPKLMKLFAEHGIRAEVLTTKVLPKNREAWVQKRVGSGLQVLITNPSLVETGLDLNDFTTLIYYNIAYNLFTLRQASRRSWRINQTAPRIEVYFFYYRKTIQERAMRLMASKLAVASLIEGNFSDEGLAAMSDTDDMTSALARELTMGIRDEVEDLSEAFKKMAFIKADDYHGAYDHLAIEAPSTCYEEVAPCTPIGAPAEEIKLVEVALPIAFAGKRKHKQMAGQLALFDLTG